MCPSTPSSLLACFECWKKFANEFLWWLIQYFVEKKFHFFFRYIFLLCSCLSFSICIVECICYNELLNWRIFVLLFVLLFLFVFILLLLADCYTYIGSYSNSSIVDAESQNRKKKCVLQTLDRHAIIKRVTVLLVAQFLISKLRQTTFSTATAVQTFFDTIERLLKFALIL